MVQVAASDRAHDPGTARARDDELARALDEVERHRRFIQAIFDSIDVGLVLLDERGAYLTMNRRHACFMDLAYPDGHAGQAGQTGAVYAEDGERLLTRAEMPSLRAAAGEEFDDVRMWVGADPLSRRALSVSARSVRDDDGGFRGAALAYKDVTDYLRAMLVKDQFVATVSHEFRTPLTSVNGYVDLLLEQSDELSPAVRSGLSVIQRNTDRLHRLVADLLLAASSDALELAMPRATTDVTEVVLASVESARPAAERAGVTLLVECPVGVGVRADALRLAQVVDNLLSNAVKYGVPGGWVRVEVVEVAEAAGHVELRVSDNGIGIGDADQARLFSRFFRAREAEARSIQGVGLGLSIVRQIVEAYGGTIRVESEPGSGSTFVVRLPRSDSDRNRDAG